LNDTLMESLADNGNGSYAYVDDGANAQGIGPDEAHKLFVEDLISNLQVIALNAKIQVDFNPDVVAYYRLIAPIRLDRVREPGCGRRLWLRHSLTSATKPWMLVRSAPPVTARTLSATALYAVTFRPNADGRIATVQLRWEDPDTHKVTERASKSTDRALTFATSTPGTWRRTSRVPIPATSWP
jgi:Ca-activated chloride channel family protein